MMRVFLRALFYLVLALFVYAVLGQAYFLKCYVVEIDNPLRQEFLVGFMMVVMFSWPAVLVAIAGGWSGRKLEIVLEARWLAWGLVVLWFVLIGAFLMLSS
jgi:hypothetical protein